MTQNNVHDVFDYETMYQQGLSKLTTDGKCGEKEVRMLKTACENLVKLEQEEKHFAEMEQLGSEEGGWSEGNRLRAEQSLVKRWRTFQVDAARYGWTPVSRRDVATHCVSSSGKTTSGNDASSDPMEQLLRESQSRMGISLEKVKAEPVETLMDVLEVDKPAQYVNEADFNIPNKDENL